jgi:hypothetical protein
VNAPPAAVGIADVKLHHALTSPLLENLDVRLTPREAVLQLWEAASLPSSGRTIGGAEHQREQRLVSRLAVAEQHHPLRVGESGTGTLQEAPDEHFIPYSLYPLDHQAARWVENLRLPQRLAFAAGIAPALISL